MTFIMLKYLATFNKYSTIDHLKKKYKIKIIYMKQNNVSSYPEIHKATVISMVPIITHSFFVTGPICSSFCVAMAGASGVSLISGGKSLNRIKGVAKREINAGKLAAFNQETH